MPPVIAAAIFAAAEGTAFAVSMTTASIIAYGATTALSIGASFGLNRLLAKKGQKGEPQITQFTIRQALPVRRRAYGRNKLGGALFVEIATPASLQPLTFGLLHCEGPIDAIEEYWLNDTLSITGGGLGGINNALPWAFYVALESRLGNDSESVNTLLAPYAWTGTQAGLCHTVVQCRQPIQPEKNFQYYFPNGIPALRIVARCAKVYDPRDGTQSWSNPATWKWSRNPALIALDYLTFARVDAAGISIPRGMGLSHARMNLASFIAAANLYDEPVATTYAYDAFGNVIVAAGTEARYSCDGDYDMSQAPTEVLDRILATCDGTRFLLADGTVGIHGGKWTAPTVTIDDSMILSADLSQGNGNFASYNQLKISITATNLDYQVVEGSPYDDFADQDDNGVIARDFPLPFVHSYSQARRLAKIQQAKDNPRWRYHSLLCNLGALNALGEEFVHVTDSAAGIDEDFIVLDFKLLNEGGIAKAVELQLASMSAAAFAWNEATEDLPPPGPSIGISPATPAAPVISQIVSDDRAAGFATVLNPAPVLVLLTPGDGTALATFEVQHRLVGASVWTTTSGAASGGMIVLSGYALNDDIELQARALSTAGLASAYTAIIQHVVGATGPANAGPITSLLALGIAVDLGGVGTPAVFEDLGDEMPPSYFVDLNAIARR